MASDEEDAASVAEGNEDNSDDGDGSDSDNSQQQGDRDSVNDEESDDGHGDAASVAEGHEESRNEGSNEDNSDDGNGNESDNSDNSRQHDDGSGASDEESDDDDDNDDENDSDISSDDSDSNEGDENDGQTGDANITVGEDGLSEYERLRLERIKRNKARLVQLGLEGGFPKIKKQPSQSKRRKSTEIFPAGPKRRSRRSTDKIDYTEPSLSITQVAKAEKENLKGEKGKDAENPESKKGGRKEETGKPKGRIPRFIFDEFRYIDQHKKRMMKLSNKNLRIAETEIGFWQKKAKTKAKVEEKKLKMEQMHKKIEEEMQIFGGGSAKDFLQQVEKRTPEIMHKISMYEYHQRVSFRGHRMPLGLCNTNCVFLLLSCLTCW